MGAVILSARRPPAATPTLASAESGAPTGCRAPLVRAHDWPERLATVVAAAQRTPFAWGRHDCALFAADCIRAMTGVDLAADFRNRYASLRGAVQALARLGYDGPVDAAAARLPEIAVRRARRGDVVAAELAYGLSLGVSVGARAMFAAPAGLLAIPLRDCCRAFRV